MLNELSNSSKVPVESLRRGLFLLEQLSEHGTLSLAAISDLAGLKRTTVHNLLKTLVLCGYVSSSGSGLYNLSDKLRLLSFANLYHRVSLGQVPGVTSVLDILSERLGETLVLACLLNGQRTVLARTRPQQAVRVSFSFLEQPSQPLWNTVTGLMLAAHVSDDYHCELLRLHGTPDSLWLPLSSPADLLPALRKIRDQGYASHLVSEVYAISIPVLDSDGNLLAALGLHMPAFRYQPKNEKLLISSLQDGARQLADALQHANSDPANAITQPTALGQQS